MAGFTSKYPDSYLLKSLCPNEEFFLEGAHNLDYEVKSKWAFNLNANCEYIYIQKLSPGFNQAVVKMSIFSAKKTADEIGEFLQELEAEGASTDHGPLVILQRFGDGTKVAVPHNKANRRTFFDCPDFQDDDNDVRGRYYLDRKHRKYSVFLCNPVQGYTGEGDWAGPVIRMSVAGMRNFVAFMEAAEAEMSSLKLA